MTAYIPQFAFELAQEMQADNSRPDAFRELACRYEQMFSPGGIGLREV